MRGAITEKPLQKVAVVAFGGNALITTKDAGYPEEQIKNAKKAVSPLVHLLRAGYELVIVHGNGPQVGLELLCVENSTHTVPPVPLDFCVAKTQGTMGYLLQVAMRNRLKQARIDKNIITLITEVVVREDDPAFTRPTKPVGPFFSEYQAKRLQKENKWIMIEDAKRGWRKVVASPRPIKIPSASAINTLVKAGNIVIAGGGGGIPVAFDEGEHGKGVEAVIDKDYTASLIASYVEAELLLYISAVDYVLINFGTPKEKKLKTIKLDTAIRYFAEGHFATGSMGPKIDACISFIKGGGKRAIVTTATHLLAALRGKYGTQIVAGDYQKTLFPSPNGDDANLDEPE
ncbi:MAG: carbamate kinase [Myxococcota bacterium]